MVQMEELLKRLDRALKRARPEFYARLLPGSTDTDLASLETALGFTVPDDLKAFLRWKNGYDYRGQLPERRDCFIPYTFLFPSHSLIITEHQAELRMYEEYPNLLNKEGYWSSMWIPFLEDLNIQYYCIDMGGSYTGNVGQVLFFDGEEGQTSIDHRSFVKWVETITAAYERNILSFAEEDRWDSHNRYRQLVKELNPGYPIIRNRPKNTA